ncbi:MAG TPA: hypothetical protein PLY78_05730 [Methanospirillum sp.]|nr:hypothetical protein [Methanospirillum sp.]
MKIENCAQCFNLFYHFVDGWVCDVTMQPVFMMLGCPMERDDVPIDLDPCYVWFPTRQYAVTHCRNAAIRRPCQFLNGYHCTVGHSDIRYARFCPLPRFCPKSGKTLTPREKYDILRMDDDL